MLQVVYRIPMTVAGGVPLWLAAAAVGLGIALALYLLSRRAPTPETGESLRLSAKGAAILALAAGAGAYFAQSKGWFPDGIPIYGFGMMLFIAFILCTWLAGRRGEREGITKETIQDLAIWIFAGGLLGARLTSLLTTGKYPTLTSWEALRPWLYELIAIWDGGIVLYGAIGGGLVAYVVAYVVLYRKRGMQIGQPAVEGPLTPSRFLVRMSGETRRLADAVAPAIALGILLGRIGCFLNGCCFGGVTCAECRLAPGVGFPVSSPPRDSLVVQGYQSSAGFTLVNVHGVILPRVAQVDPDSAADIAGLRAGDVIVKVDGHGVHNADDLDRYVYAMEGRPRGEWSLTMEVLPKGEGEETKTLTFRPRTISLYPTQLYEVISMALVFLLLYAYESFRRNPGQVVAVLMVCYGIHRYLNEILRDDPRPKGLESHGSEVLIVAGVALWVWLQYFKAPEEPVLPVGDLAKKLGLTPVTAPSEAIQGATPVQPGP